MMALSVRQGSVLRHAWHQLFDRKDERGIAHDPGLSVDDVGELLERLETVVSARLRDRLPDAWRLRRVQAIVELREQRIDIEIRVPNLECRHACELSHRLPIRASAPTYDPATLLLPEPAVPPGHLEAGGQPLHVPLPWPWGSLVEVIHVEDEVSFGGAEESEVREVGVAAELNPQAGGWCCCEVRCHRKSRPAEVAER